MQKIKCRWAPSLGRLESTAELIWGTENYNPETDKDEPCVFFGLYGLPDFYALWRHRGKKWILWAGTDITHFRNGYWLDDEGKIRLESFGIAQWIDKNCESWVENEVERRALWSYEIESKVCPSFLADINQFNITYKWSEKPKLWTSVSGDNFELYGWDKIPKLVKENPDIEFHLYGNEKPFYYAGDPMNFGIYPKSPSNLIIHGRVPKEQMNEEVSKMQGALRLTEFDGFSEILGKSIMWGQWPVSIIEYPHILKVSEINQVKDKKKPNLEGRDYYFQRFNKYPWNVEKTS